MSSRENKGELSVLKRAYLALEQKDAELAELRSSIVRERLGHEPIAIVGLGCRLPGDANDPESYWELLRNGVDAVSEVSADRWDTAALHSDIVRHGGFLRDIDGFDPEFFGISPRETISLDPQQRLLLEVSWEALERSGEITDRLAGSLTGVFIGITSSDYAQLQMKADGAGAASDIYAITGTALNAAAGRLSYTFGFQGPSIALDTACSSSLVAVHYACQSLRNGECNRALAGGVNLILVPAGTVALSKGKVLSPDGRCKAFDASADGMGRGEGCGIVVLKRLSDAIKDRNCVLALIRSSAVNQDGSSSGLTVPNGPAQEALIRAALEKAGLHGSDIGYVEAHGTGTPLGDPIEIRALGAVYGARPLDQPLIVGSVKTNFGHLESAAGIAGLIKTVLALQHGEIPPHLHFNHPSTKIDWSQFPVSIPTEPVQWPTNGKKRFAAISAFGFSGTNAHTILEEYIEEAPSPVGSSAGEANILTVSAKAPAALRELSRLYSEHLRRHPELSLADVCFTANTGRDQFNYRRAVSGTCVEEICRELESPFTPRLVSGRPRAAFVFDRGDGQFDRQYHCAALFRSWGVEPAIVWGEASSECVAACLAGVFNQDDGRRMAAAWQESQEIFDSVARQVRYARPIIRVASEADSEALATPDYWIRRRTATDRRSGEFSEQYIVVRIPTQVPDQSALLKTLGSLWEQGVTVDWTAFERGRDSRRVELPVYPFQRTRYWLEKAPSSETADWLYEVLWKAKPAPVDVRVFAHELAAAVSPEVAQLTAEIDPNIFDAAMASLEGLAISYARRALEQLGWKRGSTLQVVPQHERMLARVIEIATEEAPGEDCSLEAIQRLVRKYPLMDAELRMLQQCGSRLHEVLNGETNVLQLLFPSEGGLSASALYAESPAARIANHVVGRLVSRYLDESRAGGKLRVLEIGAGTGGTTASILPHLPADRTEYVFTDVSPWFLPQAREKFREYPFISYRVLNIEETQADGQFDLIVAANVLHATRDLAESVRHVRQMLKPGGSLILLEGTAPLRFIDLIFGWTDGWWRFNDKPLRPGHPLIGVPNWERLLNEEGFAETSAICASSGLLSRQAVIVATASTSTAVPAVREPWIVFAEKAASPLCGILAGKGRYCVGVLAGEQYRKVSENLYEIDPAAREDYDRLFREISPASGHGPAGIAHLWSLESESLPTIQQIVRRSCGSALLLAQSVLSAGWKSAPALWIATRGAQHAGSKAQLRAPGQSLTWGMAKAIALEHPELRCVLVDLDPDASEADQAARFAEEIEYRDGDEGQVAYRDDTRFVARINRYQARAKSSVVISADKTYLITGGLSGLGLCVAQWLVQRGARHLVLMARSGVRKSVEPILNEMSRQGVHLRTVRADVSRYDDVKEILSQIDADFPVLCGVVHSAGVLDDGVLLQQNWSRFQTVMAAKVDGAWNLHQLTQDMKLDFFVLFSSVAAFLGSAGQANHAAVNAFLDALAFYRRSQGQHGLSINWGAWSEIGSASDAVAQRVRLKGLGTIAPADGLQILDRLLSEEAIQAAAMPVDWPRFSAQFESRPVPAFLSDLVRPRQNAEYYDSVHPESDQRILQDLSPEGRSERLVSFIQQQAAAVLRLSPSRLDIHQPLNSLGLDSLMALELRHRVRNQLDIEIPLVSFMAGSSVSELAARIASGLESGSEGTSIVTGQPAESDSKVTCALSYGQKALWFIHQNAADSAAYNAAFSVRIRSRLDPARVRDAFQELIHRHESLRTTFERRTGEVVQVIHRSQEIRVEEIDAATWSLEDLRLRVTEAYRRPFDLETGPLLRVTLFRCGSEDQVFLLTIHHIVCDGWSIGMMVDEFHRIYEARSAGAEPALPALGAQYADFVRWQDSMLAGVEGQRAWDYWQRQLAGDLMVLDLPTDHPRPPAAGTSGASYSFDLEGGLVEKLHQLCRAEAATLYTVCAAAFQVLLHRYTNQDEILIGSPANGRGQERFAQTVGYLVNPIVLRGKVSAKQSFREFLDETRKVILGAIEHQDFPFPLLVERLHPARDPSRAPLFQVFFLLQKPHEALVEMEPFEIGQLEGQFDLTLDLLEAGSAIHGVLRYDTNLFEAGTIVRMKDHFENILRSVVDDPEVQLGDIALLSAVESRRALFEWNDTSVNYPGNFRLHELIEAQVRRSPDATALICGDERLAYSDLNRRANQLAARLRTLGVGPDILVGVCMERSVDMVVSLLGILKSGGAYVPLDPEYPRDRLLFMARDSQCGIVLSHSRFAPLLAELDSQVLFLDQDQERAGISTEANYDLPINTDPQNLAYMIFTSGSTGTPKGAMNTHRGICNRLLWMQDAYGLNSDSRVLQKTPFSFDVSVWEFFWPLMTGACLVMAKPGGHKDSAYLVDIICSLQVTTIHFVPSMLQVFLEDPNVSQCTSLEHVVASGEALTRELERRFFQQLGAKLHNLYGPTEAAVDVTFWECVPGGSGASVPIGRPIANTQMYVLDRALQPVPAGVAGELHIGGDGVGRGYFNRPDLTAARFIPNPFRPGERLYKTGDLVRYLPDGCIEFLGRMDDQVKVRGFRIELGEIEAALAKHSGVKEAAVTVLDHPSGGRRLVAHVVRDSGNVGDEDLRRFLQSSLPDYMVPSSFVYHDRLPLSPNGKLDRRAVAGLQLPGTSIRQLPQTELEMQIAEVWKQVLEIESVGVRDNFFDLGGHSLLMNRVLYRLNSILPRPLAFVDLFQYPTIHALAEFISPQRKPQVQKDESRTGTSDRIAIVGISCRFPGAGNVKEFWTNLANGTESIAFFSAEELIRAGVDPGLVNDPNYVPAGGILRDIDLFDANLFDCTPREAEVLDVQHRIFLECAWESLEDAGYDPEQYSGSVGVYAGAGLNSYFLNNVFRNREALGSLGGFQVMMANEKDFLPTRVSYKLNLKGPSVSVQTACSTSLVSVHFACAALSNRECDMALAGGVSVRVPQIEGYLYEEGMIHSPDGHCRAFDRKAGGTIGGSGAGVVVLKRLEDAIADRDRIWAVILGSAINNDGSSKVGYTAPSVQGQQGVISQALTAAGVQPGDIGYIEAHGTGTMLGDPIEVRALTNAFGAIGNKGFCALGAVKTNIGHLDAAAGVAGLIKTVLALEHEAVPPSINFEEPNPEIDFAATPFYVNTSLREWKSNGKPRRAGVSSFGIGGTNAHVVLEEAPRQEPAVDDSHPEVSLLVLSARSSESLDAAAGNLLRHLRENPELNIHDAAYTLQLGRRALSHRFAALCRDRNSAIELLQQISFRRGHTFNCEKSRPPVVFMFSGQGAQYVSMGRDLYAEQPVFRDYVDRCSKLLEPEMGLDLREILFPPSPERERISKELDRTAVTQPALFVIEYALAQLWISWGVRPEAMIGHSIGEYVAACLAGVLSLEDALILVAERGRIMQQLPEGAMVAVQASIEEITPLLNGICLAAINGPDSIVVSGDVADIDRLEQRLDAANILSQRLRTSHAFHSRMMEPALDSFVDRVKRVRLHPPSIPYISNVSGTWITADEATNPEYFARHLRHTVRFSEGLLELLKIPRSVLLEIGPGCTLTNLARRHLNPQPVYDPLMVSNGRVVASMRYAKDKDTDQEAMLQAAGSLWLNGVDIDWKNFHGGRKLRRVSLPTYPFERQRYWIEPSEGHSAPVASKVPNTGIADWTYVPSWKRTVLPNRTPEIAGEPLCWLILTDDSSENSIGNDLADRLRERGETVTVAVAGAEFRQTRAGFYTINPGHAEDYNALLDHVRNEQRLPDKIVHLWNLQNTSEPSSRLPGLERSLNVGFYSLLFLAQALGNEDPEHSVEIIVVSNNMQEVTGNDLLCPEKATLLGPVKIIPKEYPNIACRSIDFDTTTLEALWSELQAERADPIVASRGRHRWVSTFEPLPLDQTAPAFRKGGVYLITGGFGGIGFAMAEHLARTFAARLVLIGRSSPPGEKLAALERLGAEVLAATADVADPDRMRQVLDDAVARFGAIHGVIHAAGVAGGGIIQIKTREMAAKVLSPKIQGAIVLDELLKNTSLDFLIFMSSVTSVLAEAGQVDYCSANLFLDAFARYRRPAIASIAINWDTWSEVGMAVNVDMPIEMEQLRQARLLDGLSTREGIDVFGRILKSGLSHVIVSRRDLEFRMSQEAELRAVPIRRESTGAVHAVHARPNLQAEYVAPRSETEQTLALMWQEMFGVEKVGVDDSFFELGGHSLLATQLLTRIRDVFGVRLPISSVFSAPAIAQLASLVEARQIEHARRDEIARILSEVDRLSDEEVKRQLARGAAGNE